VSDVAVLAHLEPVLGAAPSDTTVPASVATVCLWG
jgi:hypothetical protein